MARPHGPIGFIVNRPVTALAAAGCALILFSILYAILRDMGVRIHILGFGTIPGRMLEMGVAVGLLLGVALIEVSALAFTFRWFPTRKQPKYTSDDAGHRMEHDPPRR
jgi:hypothetical protein